MVGMGHPGSSNYRSDEGENDNDEESRRLTIMQLGQLAFSAENYTLMVFLTQPFSALHIEMKAAFWPLSTLFAPSPGIWGGSPSRNRYPQAPDRITGDASAF
jgi:hypothetical protein